MSDWEPVTPPSGSDWEPVAPGGKTLNVNLPMVHPGTAAAVRQAILVARSNRLRQAAQARAGANILGSSMAPAAPSGLDLANSVADQTPPESDGSVRRYADLGQAGVREGLMVDTPEMAANLNPYVRLATNVLARLAGAEGDLSEVDSQLHDAREQGAANLGLTDPTVQPHTTGERYMYGGARVLGNSILPETTLAGIGVATARRLANGVAESSLSRVERMGLDYVRHPARVVAANLLAPVGTIAGGDAAAYIDPRLRPVGEALGGLAGGMAPFEGMPRRSVRPPESEPVISPESNQTIGPVPPGGAEAPVVNVNHAPVHEDLLHAAREQALNEAAETHGITRDQAMRQYVGTENPDFVASVRDRTNEIYQHSVVESAAPTPESSEIPPTEPSVVSSVNDNNLRSIADLSPHEQLELSRRMMKDQEPFLIDETTGDQRWETPEEKAARHAEIDAAHDDLGRQLGAANDDHTITSENSSVEIPTEDSQSPVERFGQQGYPVREIANDNPSTPTEGQGGHLSDEPPHGGEGAPPKPPSIVERLTTALNNAGKVVAEQETLRAKERSTRVARGIAAREGKGGTESLRAELAATSGEMPKKDFESIAGQFTQPELHDLFNHIRDHPGLQFWEGIHARLGLEKLLDGQLPQANELAALGRVLPKEFIDAALQHRSHMTKVLDVAGNVLNVPRALMSSVDLSIPFRQGVFFVGRKEFWKNLLPMVRYAASKEKYEAAMSAIRERPNYPLYRVGEPGGLQLTDLDHNLNTREEAFQTSYAERIPTIGALVRFSSRGATAFLNKVRADVMDSLLQNMEEQGIDLNTKESHFGKTAHDSIISLVNNGTGRGGLWKLESSAPLLNAALFSPRLNSSRITLMNPWYYYTLHPAVRREALKSLLSFGAIAATTLGLATYFLGADVEMDARSSDFMKVRFGNTRYDPWGGFQQYGVLAARLATNQRITGQGEIQTLGARFGSPTRLDAMANFLLSKASPIPSFFADYFRGRDPVGVPFNATNEVLSRVTPMAIQDMADLIKDRGPTGILMSMPGFLGIGVQTYQMRDNHDVYGRPVDRHNAEADPAALEVQRLSVGLRDGQHLVGNPSHVIGNDASENRRVLTDDEYQNYRTTSGQQILTELHTEMASPEWRTMSDADKREEVRMISRYARQDARDRLFPDTPTPAAPPPPQTGVTATVTHSASAPSSDWEPVSASPSGGSDWEPLSTSSSATPASESDWEPVAPPSSGRPGQPVQSARSVVESLFPGIHVTQEHRDPNSRLGRANPDSWHNLTHAAVDVRPIHGMTFSDYVSRVRDAGYTIIEQKDEVHNPSRWATGPHWHLVIGERA